MKKEFNIFVEGVADVRFINYENIQHWNLDADYLEPLREFLSYQLCKKQE